MEIKLYNDLVFKWIFGRQENVGPLISLLNAATNEPGKFCDVQILNPFDVIEPFTDERQGILDIRGKDCHSLDWFDLEVQVVNQPYYPQRSKYYLAGLYRQQLEKNVEINYHELQPCYGIHILVQNHFDSEEDSKWWYNHFAMLNTRSYKPLVSHWHLYYIELKKFLECLKDKSPMTELEQWTYFLGTIQDNTKPLDEKIRDNKAIQEVHEMLQTFTKDDRLREQYRLREEFLRDQLSAKAETDKLRQEHLKALQEKKAAQEAEKAAQEAEKQERNEKEQILARFVNLMYKNGSTKQEIARELDVSTNLIDEILS